MRGLRLWQKLAHFQPSTFAIKGIRSNWGWLNPITNHFFNNFQRRGGQKDKNSGTGNLSLFAQHLLYPLLPEYFGPQYSESEVNVGVVLYCCRWPPTVDWVGVWVCWAGLGGTMKSARWRQLGCLLVTGAPPPAAYRSPQPSPPAPHRTTALTLRVNLSSRFSAFAQKTGNLKFRNSKLIIYTTSEKPHFISLTV